jgi:hypothetical protein
METLEHFNTCNTKAEFKDKFARLVQYGCRGLIGVLADLGVGNKELIDQLKAVQTTMSEARRAGRFFKELSVAPMVLKDLDDRDSLNKVLSLGSRAALITFFLVDHFALLQKWKIFGKGGQPGDSVKLAMKFFTLAHFFNLLIQLKKLKEELDNEGTPKYNKAKREVAAMSSIKAALLVLQGLHISGLVETKDSLVGVAGVVTSLMDLQALCPVKRT